MAKKSKIPYRKEPFFIREINPLIEFDLVKGMYVEYWQDKNFKVAVENPEAFLNNIQYELSINIAYRHQQLHLLYRYNPKTENRDLVGFLRTEIDLDVVKKKRLYIADLFIKKEHRKSKAVMVLLNLIVLLGDKYNIDYFTLHATDKQRQEHWQKIGFKPEMVLMEFHGNADELRSNTALSRKIVEEGMKIEQ